MRTHRFLRIRTGVGLLVWALSCTGPIVTGDSVLAHGEDMAEGAPSHSRPATPPATTRPETVGLQAASWATTIPYGAAKIAYAIGGGIVGGLAWVTTGGNTEVAKSIWIPSMTGDYIVQPQHLTREKHLYFVGVASEGPRS